MKTITVWPSGNEYTWHKARKGAVFFVELHGVKYGDLRNNPPRIRLLEPGREGEPTRCEILDEWPDAPAYWPDNPKLWEQWIKRNEVSP